MTVDGSVFWHVACCSRGQGRLPLMLSGVELDQFVMECVLAIPEEEPEDSGL